MLKGEEERHLYLSVAPAPALSLLQKRGPVAVGWGAGDCCWPREGTRMAGGWAPLHYHTGHHPSAQPM